MFEACMIGCWVDFMGVAELFQTLQALVDHRIDHHTRKRNKLEF